jgi:hypothetical protein
MRVARVNTGWKGPKYKSGKCQHDGISFDSKKEMLRYCQLKDEVKLGDILCHPRFQLIPAVKIYDFEKNKIKTEYPVHYSADFLYFDDLHKSFCIEDVKGFKTKDYQIKKKLFLSQRYIEDFEVPHYMFTYNDLQDLKGRFPNEQLQTIWTEHGSIVSVYPHFFFKET